MFIRVEEKPNHVNAVYLRSINSIAVTVTILHKVLCIQVLRLYSSETLGV
jgi:hypothetical protein